MRISNSKANTYRRCPKRFEYKYEMGLRLKEKAVQLERGSWLHEMLEAYYITGEWKPTWRRLKKEFYTLFEEEREELGDLPEECARIMRAYIKKWKKEDRRYRVIDAELDEIIKLPNGLEFNFVIDLIVEDLELGGLWLWDHKSLKKFMDEDYMLLDVQLARYFWSAEKMGYTPLRGVMFNELRTKAPTIPKLVSNGTRLEKRKDVDTTYEVFMGEIEKHGFDPDDYDEILQRLKLETGKFFRRTMMPKDRKLTVSTMQDLVDTVQEIELSQRRGRFPRTINKACTFDCDYKDVCITQLFGGDATSLMKANYETREEQKKKRAAKVRREQKRKKAKVHG